MKKTIYYVMASSLSFIALVSVYAPSLVYVYNPEPPEELLK